jgi:hypothetical protein
LAVNIAAIVVLCAGAFFLISFNGRMDEQIRTGSAIDLMTERALLEEIRRSMAAGGLAAAWEELEGLKDEQEKIALLDALFTGGLASAGDLIRDGKYEEAAAVVVNLRNFCNTNSFATASVFQAKREFYNKSFDSIEKIISRMLEFEDANREGIDLLARNQQLEDENKKLRESNNASSSSQANSLSEANRRNRELAGELTELKAESDKRITELRGERDTLEKDKNDLQKREENYKGAVTTAVNALNDYESFTTQGLLDAVRRAFDVLETISKTME